MRYLPRRQREVIVLRYFLDLSEDQAAHRLALGTSFDPQLRSALEHHAKEISMTSDLHEAEATLQPRSTRADRQRRIGYALAAAAVVVLITAVALVRLPGGRKGAEPAPSTAPTVAYTTQKLSPNVSAHLPAWTAADGVVHDVEPDGDQFMQSESDYGEFAPGKDREISFFTVKQTYPVDGKGGIVLNPTYAQYVDIWKGVAANAEGNVFDVSTTTVGGRPATVMTVTPTVDIKGVVPCRTATATFDGCSGISFGRTVRLAVVDQGAGSAPTLLSESWNTSTPAGKDFPAEFAAWTSTVSFPR